MKKLILAFSAVALILFSCSKSDDAQPANPPVDNSILLKKVIQTPVGRSPITMLYTYSSNKISRIDISNGYYGSFTYTGDLITKVDTYTTTNALVGTETYSYNVDKLSAYVYKDFQNNTGIKHLCTMNTDGTMSVSSYSGDTNSQTIFKGSKKIFFLNGIISKIEYYQASNGALFQTVNYSYDSKNSPMKNVVGLDKTIFVQGSISKDCAFNIISENSISNPSNAIISANTFTYTFDSNNYPISSIAKDKTATQYSSSQYFY